MTTKSKKERVDALMLTYSYRQIAEKLDESMQAQATLSELANQTTTVSQANARVRDVVCDWLAWRNHMHCDGTLGVLDRFLDELRDAIRGQPLPSGFSCPPHGTPQSA